MAKKIVTNEELISTLLTHGTIREASQVLGISERTIYNMMSEREFCVMYEGIQATLLNNSVTLLQNRISEAINTIGDIMNDKEVNPQTRLQAAQTILKNGFSMQESIFRIRDRAAKDNDPLDMENTLRNMF